MGFLRYNRDIGVGKDSPGTTIREINKEGDSPLIVVQVHRTGPSGRELELRKGLWVQIGVPNSLHLFY